MSAWLSATVDGQDERWVVEADEFVIGRAETATLSLPITHLSRFHARISRGQYQYLLSDLGSRNGTFLNGQAVGHDSVPLTTGDEIVLAGVVSLRFDDPTATPLGPRIGRVRGIWIDPESDMVWVDALPVEPALSQAQLRLLRTLYAEPHAIVRRERVIAAVWPDVDPAGVTTEAVDGLFKRLRKRLRQVQPQHEYIETVRGYGFRLRQP